MVRIPTPETQGAQPIGNVQLDTPRDAYQTVQASGWGREGAQLQELGNALGSLGGAIAQQQQDIAMLEAQKAFSDFELELFDPNSGIMTRHGSNAQGVTSEVEARLQKLMDGVLGNGRLTGAARRAVEKYAIGQRQRLLGKVGAHEYGEGETYKRSLLDADIEASVDRMIREINDPEAREANLNRIESSVRSRDDFLGLPETAQRQAIEAATTQALVAAANDLSRYSPVKAKELLEAYQDKIDPTEYSRVMGLLEPRIREWNGQIQGRAAFYLSEVQNRHGLYGQFGVSMSQMLAAAEAELGPGQIGISSGYRSPMEQANIIYGNWHKFDLNAADRERWMADVNTLGPVAAGQKWAPVFDKAKRTAEDGFGDPFRAWIGLPGMSNHQKRGAADLSYNSAEARAWAHRNAARFGMHFRLDNESWHIEPIGGAEFAAGDDSPEALAAATMAALTATGGDSIDPEAVGTDPTQLILGIADPTERAAAMSTFTAMQGFSQQQQAAQVQQISSSLIADINNAHAAGAPLDPGDVSARLTLEQRALLGDQYNSILEYSRKMATGEYVVTTPEGQAKLVRYTAMSTSADPAEREAFLAIDFETTDINDIEPTARMALIERQASMRQSMADAQSEVGRFPVTTSEVTAALQTVVTDNLMRRGIDPNSDEGKAFANMATVQTLTQLERMHRASPGSFSTDPLAIREIGRAMLGQEVGSFNPPGWGSEEDVTYGELLDDLYTMSPSDLARTSMRIPVRRPDGTMTELEIPSHMMRNLVNVYTRQGIDRPDDIVLSLLQTDYVLLAELSRRYGGTFTDAPAEDAVAPAPDMPVSP